MAAIRSLPRLAARTQTAWSRPSGAFVPSYWADRHNSCPACARSNWWVGRHSAECGYCGATLPIAGAAIFQSVPDAKAA